MASHAWGIMDKEKNEWMVGKQRKIKMQMQSFIGASLPDRIRQARERTLAGCHQKKPKQPTWLSGQEEEEQCNFQ